MDVVLAAGERLVFDLDRDDQRAALAGHVTAGQVASLKTREFDFRQVFLKLTGTEFDAVSEAS